MDSYSLPSSPFSYQAAAKPVCNSCDISFIPPAVKGGYFAFAKVKREVCLVQGM